MLSLYQSVNLLEPKSDWSLEDLKRSFREKAKRYHPDTQTDLTALEKSHEMMILLNNARDVLESFWHEKGSFADLPQSPSQVSRDHINLSQVDEILEKLKDRYRYHRERAKKGLYVFYRFNLQRVALRGTGAGSRWYSEYRRYLGKAIKDLRILLNDVYSLKEQRDIDELEELYRVFMKGFIFFDAFQRAAECSDILPDYNSSIQEKQVFQHYRKGSVLIDQALLILFLKKIEGEKVVLTQAEEYLRGASHIFSQLISTYPNVSWIREINIKSQLVLSSLSYLYEFYS